MERLVSEKRGGVYEEVPESVQLGILVNIFFIDNDYMNRSGEFIPHIFKAFPGKDFLLISIPNNQNYFKFLESF